jgi:hypothetical protein
MAATGGPYTEISSTTLQRIKPDPVLDRGVPDSFLLTLQYIEGTESRLAPKEGATAFYSSSHSPHGALIGASHGAGRVLNFSTLITEIELSNPDYATLFANAVEWASQGPAMILDRTRYCIGETWHADVVSSLPNTPVRLIGTSNGEPWEIPGWGATDSSGRFSTQGVFGATAEANHTVRVHVGGKISNVAALTISSCPRQAGGKQPE